MSDLLFAFVAAAAGPADTNAVATATHDVDAQLVHALSLSVPTTDGFRGAQISYERFLADRRISIGFSGALRQSAAADYTGMRFGVGAHVRRFWRASNTGRGAAWLSKLPAGSPAGWFYGGGVHVDSVITHDDVDDEIVGNTLQVGLSGEVGYRIAPWRGLAITPSVGIETHRDFDLSGRLPGWNQGGLTAGLELGWLF